MSILRFIINLQRFRAHLTTKDFFILNAGRNEKNSLFYEIHSPSIAIFPPAIFPSTRPLYKRTGVRRCCPLSWYRKYSFPRRKSYGIGYIINPVFLILRQLQNPICIRRPFVFAASLKFQTHTLICFTAVVLSVLSVSFNINYKK